MAQREIFFDADDVVIIPTECPKCDHPGEQRMCVTEIPGFKEVLMMAFRCEECKFENNELKPAGASDMGRRFTLTVTQPEDLERDAFQSFSGSIEVEKIGLQFTGGPNANKFTTVAEIIRGMVADLTAQSGSVESLPEFLQQASLLFSEELMPYEIILSDPVGNSYIGKNDTNTGLTWYDYEKTEEERDRWG